MRPKLTSLKPRVATLRTGSVKTMQPGGWRTPDMTSSQRGYGYRWQKARDRHLNENPLCTMCQSEGRTTAATVVDHIKAHRGDQRLFWDESNWQSLCAHHHSSHKQRLEAEEARNGEGI